MNEEECEKALMILLKKDVRYRNSNENLAIVKLRMRMREFEE